MTEQIKELEKALERSLMHENECAFVHTSTIKICLDSLKAWEEVLQELEKSNWDWIPRDKAIDIIKQKLEGIKE